MAKENTDQLTSANISSNTLFHFTNSIDNLLNILTNEFSPHYCLEVSELGGGVLEEYAIPMVSFCDLPLFLIKRHLKFYGKYGIGLRKKWGINNRITPILYTHNNSILTKLINEFGIHILDRRIGTSPSRSLDSIQTAIKYFMKPYEGTAYRHGKYIKNIRFYDEREWRFVPEVSIPPVILKEDYSNIFYKSERDQELAQIIKIPFVPDDIQYIIVKEEAEILQMIRDIERIKGKFSADEVKILTTKIISSERISEDF